MAGSQAKELKQQAGNVQESGFLEPAANVQVPGFRDQAGNVQAPNLEFSILNDKFLDNLQPSSDCHVARNGTRSRDKDIPFSG